MLNAKDELTTSSFSLKGDLDLGLIAFRVGHSTKCSIGAGKLVRILKAGFPVSRNQLF